jgi:hypothetical protein
LPDVDLIVGTQKFHQVPGNLAQSNPSIIPDVKAGVDGAVMPSMGAAMQTVGGLAMTPSGKTSGFAQVDLSGSSALVNQWTQFDVHNKTTGGTIADFKVRIGSNLALPGTYAEYGIPAGAADSSDCEDQNGNGCLAIRGFSRITCSKPVLVTEIQVTATDTTQLNAVIQTLELELDGTVTPKKINVSATQQKSDQRTNLLVIENVSIILDSTHCLEFTSKGDQAVTWKLKCEAWANVGLFMPYGN